MGFSQKQVRALRRNPDQRYLKRREIHGRELTYMEGWYAISEANRIFGFDGWSRETLDSRCVLSRDNKGSFVAVYSARVRLSVYTDGVTLIREGHGTSEGHGETPGEAHDIGIKAAETDATKRALATFGRPFGLELYRNTKTQKKPEVPQNENERNGELSPPVVPGNDLHPDDTTPIPRPSRYYGRRTNDSIGDQFRNERRQVSQSRLPPAATVDAPRLAPGKIDKSELAISEPKRLRDKGHLKFVGAQPCLICGRFPSDAHHVRFAQPRALGLKVSDEFTVPLCRGHHRQLHQAGDETAWWSERSIKPLEVARKLWEQTRPTPIVSPPDPSDPHQSTEHSSNSTVQISVETTSDETKPFVPSHDIP